MKKHVYIIAEAGVNHNANIDTAYKMIDAAKASGADAVKFQTAVPELVISKFAQMADYQIKNIGQQMTQLEMAKAIHLPITDYKKLSQYCDHLGITFLSTAFDLVSLDYLMQLGLEIFKIPSGEITNLPYLKVIGAYRKKIILSTGMATLNEVKAALDVLVNSGANINDITILHANTEYPTPMCDVNLNAMVAMGQTLGVNYGYSDHTLGIEVDIAAVAMGASVIEKHFTLDKAMQGPDHVASLSPKELTEMVKCIRNIEQALGTHVKSPSPSEEKNIANARKSLVAKQDIKAGDVFSDENLCVKRPGNGISPMNWETVIGTKATRDYQEDELI
ncbi:MAG: N-acetylneuraminate synthase [Legionellales bacterium]|nr:N-acetylneuraminate synthase [Legionellales bacterium]|tara:strand:+ start:4149 stop:5150 length:1002 start_codon:yes stop_codon:yes gene_type:complete